MSPIDSIIQRIRKLLAHADSAQDLGNQEEAEAFAAKASELLLRHKLDHSDLEMEEEEDDTMGSNWFDLQEAAVGVHGGGGRTRSGWMEHLIGVLCAAHFLRYIVMVGSRKVVLVGRQSDRQVVSYLFTVLSRTAQRLATQYESRMWYLAEKTGGSPPPRAKRSYLIGFVAGIRTKLEEMRQSVEVREGQWALVRFDQAMQAVNSYYDKEWDKKTSRAEGLSAKATREAFNAGVAAGRAQNLTAGVQGGASQGNRPTLHQGPRLLPS